MKRVDQNKNFLGKNLYNIPRSSRYIYICGKHSAVVSLTYLYTFYLFTASDAKLAYVSELMLTRGIPKT